MVHHLARANDLRALLAAAVALVLSCLVFPSVSVYSANLSEITQSLAHILCASLTVDVVLLVCLLLLGGLAHQLSPNKGMNSVSTLFGVLSAYALITNFIFPFQNGLIDGRTVPPTWHLDNPQIWLALLILGVCLVLCLIAKQFFRQLITALSLCGLCWTAYITSANAWARGSVINVEKVQNLVQLSKQRNVLIISFDSLQSDHVSAVFKQHPELAAAFDGFTFYPETLGTAPLTRWSIRITLSGRFPPLDFRRLISHDHASYLTTAFKHAGYHVGIMNLGHPDCPDYADACAMPTWMTKAWEGIQYTSDAVDLIRAGFLRILPAQPPEVVLDHLSNIMTLFKAPPAEHTLWRPWPAMLAEFDLYTQHLNTRSKKPVFQFQHYLFTHPPLLFDADCKYKPELQDAQNTQTAMGITTCALRKSVQLIHRLKSLGIYDQTDLIFTSDHGFDPIYNQFKISTSSGIFHPNAQITGSHYSAGKFLPMLLIKKVGQRGKLKRSNQPVSMLNLAPELCQQFLSQRICSAHQYLMPSISAQQHTPQLGRKLLLFSPDYSIGNLLIPNPLRNGMENKYSEQAVVTLPPGNTRLNLETLLNSAPKIYAWRNLSVKNAAPSHKALMASIPEKGIIAKRNEFFTQGRYTLALRYACRPKHHATCGHLHILDQSKSTTLINIPLIGTDSDPRTAEKTMQITKAIAQDNFQLLLTTRPESTVSIFKLTIRKQNVVHAES